MKRLFYFVLLSFVAFSCSQQQDEVKTIVAGKIENTDVKEIKMMYYDASKLERSEQLNEFKAELAEDGTFKFELDFEKAFHGISLVVDRERTSLALAVGDSVFVETDYKDFDKALKYSGQGAQKNTYLAQDYLNFSTRENRTVIYDGFAKKEPNDFLAILDSVYGKRIKELTEAQTKDAENKMFYDFMKTKFEYEKVQMMLNYPTYNAYYTGLKDSVSVPTKEYFAAVEAIKDINRPDLLDKMFYGRFVESYLAYAARKDKLTYGTVMPSKEYDFEGLDRAKDAKAKELLAIEVQEAIKAKEIFQLVKYDDVDKYTPMWEEFSKTAKSEVYKKDITKQIAIMDSLKSQTVDQEVFKIALVDTVGNETTLQDFMMAQKGKYVYVDVWATWCGPCIREIPFSNTVQTELEGKDVVFLNLCSDTENNFDKWKNMIANKEWKGNHMMCKGKTFETPVAKLFALSFVPRYVLINPEGKIERFNADRPSDGAKEMLDGFLNKSAR